MKTHVLINPCTFDVAGRTGLLNRFLSAVAERLCHVNSWVSQVESRAHLRRLNDRLLRDAGLTRWEVDSGHMFGPRFHR
ncbi:MAG: DUF1127 domain-containing protein [Pseudomonadota bacterium]